MRVRSIALSLIFAAAAAAGPACSLESGGKMNGLEDDGDAVDDDGADSDGAGGDDPGGDSADDDGADADGVDDDGDGEPDGAAGVPDGATPDAPPPPPVVAEGPYQFLSESGLYSDIESHTIASNVMEFEPEFELWSDGAEKARYIRLPDGGQINSTNMGRWVVPRGTTVWKEFADPNTGKRLETRIIQRLTNGTFYFASFIWNDDDTEAVFDPTPGASPPADIPAGCSTCTTPPCDFPDSCHVVPQSSKCIECHEGEASRLLGFSAVQLSHDGPGLTLSDLASLGLMTTPPAGGATFPVPGTPVERNAVGYIHANCGHCHSPSYGATACFLATGFRARVLPDDATVEATALFQSAVDQPLVSWVGPMDGNHTEEQLGELITDRIVSGDHSRSAIWYRMSVREFGQLPPNNDHQQMPYFATNQVDEAGLAAVELWINSLP